MTPATRALFRAVADGDVSLLRGLLAQGTDVNSTNQAGQTALMLAAAFKRNSIVSLLLHNGADIEARDDLGLTALEWAGDSYEIHELLTAPIKPPLPAAPASESAVVASATEIAEVIEPQPSKSIAHDRPVLTEEPVLKGLAAAILRDHAPKTSPNMVHASSSLEELRQPEVNIDDQPTPVHQVIDDWQIDVTGDEAQDNTWGTSKGETTDATAPSSRPLSSSRIFDLRSSADVVKPISKVEIPTFNSVNNSRRGIVVWALVAIVLVAGGFGGYRLANYLLVRPTTNAATPAASVPAIQPAAAPKKLAPAVGGDVAGAELHLPDAEYPSEATQSGTVTVQVLVSRKGVVVNAEAIDGDESLRAAAEDAAKKSAFSPEKLPDKFKKIEGTITYHFVPNQQLGTVPTEAPKEVTASNSVTVTTGGPLAGTELKLIEPDSPSSAEAGSVTVVVRVSRSGRVISWRPLDGNQQLRLAAVNAAKQSTFSADRLPGEGEVVGTITYTFR